ncbi:MAG: prepilin-type N-terminal cleavage/methylation domain-containing protein [Proteobacteria bacterium]|nr:prepilin-type N-terminal cleavage/methylation domain-containing protein [Pseudomonadota bacterium]
MRKAQQGFTLIELMIVVAIIGILAAIAVPQYQTYTKKSKFTEVTQATSPVKLAMEACFQDTGDLTSCTTPGSNGIPSDSTGNGKYVASVKTLAGNVIEATSTTTNGLTGEKITFKATLPIAGSSNLLDWTKGGNCIAAGIC